MTRSRSQRGAALLMAMLTVTLVATFAAAALWQQWRAIEIETAERARTQSSWLLTGSLDWARLILREDARASRIDHLAEPWAIPLQESRLSTFLAAERGVSTGGDEDLPEVFLSGRIIDLQSRMNVNNLVTDGVIAEADLQAFQRLFELLGLPPQELQTLAEGLRLADAKGAEGDLPLRPQRYDQLRWLGLSPATLQVLAPHATLLPGRTALNLNTASAEALAASSAELDLADAERLLVARARTQFRSREEAAKAIDRPTTVFGQQDVVSRFFEVHGRLRMESTIVNERSLVQRSSASGVNVTVTTLWRERWAGEALR